MKSTRLYLLSLAASSIIATGCNSTDTQKASEATRDSAMAKDTISSVSVKADTMLGEKVAEKGPIKIFYFKGSPDFPEAQLILKKPDDTKLYKKGGKVPFVFDVRNYQLTEQTAGHDACMCNNSSKGQHIHLIINNKPYKALYKGIFDTVLAPGHYMAVSFLSRSYHESVKGEKAWQATQFTVGDKKEKDYDLSKPMLVYSRPKGEYKGKDAENVLLDFYLMNTELSETGNKVAATINGQQFLLTKWTGYMMQGLRVGKNTIKLELVDKNGKEIEGPYNTVERTITIKE